MSLQSFASVPLIIFRLSTRCSGGKAIQVPNSYSHVVVLPPEQPRISLNGTANLAHEYESFMQGIELFSTVVVQVNHEAEQDDDSGDDSPNDISDSRDETSAKTSDHKLDACTVRVYPPLNADYESLRLPVNYMQHLGVHYKETRDGLVIHGKCVWHTRSPNPPIASYPSSSLV